MKKILTSFFACLLLVINCIAQSTPAYAEGASPVAENLELKTYRNVSVSGWLSAYDPEGDVAYYEISTNPIKGSIALEQNGSFVYTPKEGKKGRDYFGYKAIDSQGNISQEATVIIKIEKQKAKTSYNDMKGLGGEYAAIKLSEKGIFTAEQLGGSFYFNPDKAITRHEFLSICKLMFGEESYTEELLSVCEDESVTISEAARILDASLSLENVDYINLELELSEPEIQACINLNAVGILEEDVMQTEELSREAAAIMLVHALDLIENR